MSWSRRPGPGRVSGIVGPATHHLAALACRGRLLVVDLSLGAWYPYQAAAELARQLAVRILATPDADSSALDPDHVASQAAIVGRGIDAEACGDTVVRRSLEVAGLIAREFVADSEAYIAILAPCSAELWGRENVLFLRFLALAACAPSRLWILAPAASEVPPDFQVDWQSAEPAVVAARAALPDGADVLGLVPGVIDAPLARLVGAEAAIGECIRLERGALLMPVEWRCRAGEVSRLQFDTLASRVTGLDWLNAYARVKGNNLFVDAPTLVPIAWRHYSAGAVELALRLLDRARETATAPAVRAMVEAQRQGMCIASHRFNEVAESADPSPAAPPALRASLFASKGWGLAMVGRGEDALRCLDHAERLRGDGGDVLDRLYLQNIRALADLRAGDADRALAAELSIAEAVRASSDSPDRRLVYVNALNTARLYGLRGDIARASAKYEEAFVTSAGARSESDGLFVELCRARLESSADPVAHRAAWVRVALRFLAAEVPEALSARTVSAVLRARPPRDESERVELVATALESALRSALESHHCGDEAGSDVPSFRFAPLWATGTDCGRTEVHGGVGWAVALAPPGDQAQLRFDGPAYRRLARLAWETLCSWTQRHVNDSCEVQVPDARGHHASLDRRLCLELAIRLGASSALFSCETLAVPESSCGLDQFSAELAKNVAGVTPAPRGAQIRFHRFQSPAVVDGVEARLVEALVCGPVLIPDLIDNADAESLRALEEKGIVHLTLAEKPSAAA